MLIVGNGFIATSFKNNNFFRDKVIIYASGVPNIKEYTKEGGEREKRLLEKTISEHKSYKLVYFSTCSIYDMKNFNAYVRHKKNMEIFIKYISNNYIIIRLPLVIGEGNNKNNLCRYFYDCIKNNILFNLWDKAYRNVIDIEDVSYVVNIILGKNVYNNEIINVSNFRKTKVKIIVSIIENILNKKAKYKLLSNRSYYKVDIRKIRKIIPNSLLYRNNYIRKVLNKYYGN